MNKKLIILIIFIFIPILLVTGFSSWIIVGEKNFVAGITPITTNVCYINSDSSGNQYTRIEKALEVAKEGDTVYVKPGLKASDNTTSLEIRIYKDCTIKKGVTLCLPYEGTTHYSETTWGTTQVYSDSTTANKNTYRKSLVVLSEGVTLTVASGAKLLIGGIFGLQSNPVTGVVNDNYCELSLEKNASIISYGAIDCYGIVKEYDSLNNGSKIELLRGSINFPFAIYDFKGGTKSLELHTSNICPFNQFDIGNIQTLLRIHSGVSARAEYRLYMNNKQLRGKVTFCGSSSSNTLFILTSGYMDIKYTAKTLGFTVIDQIIGQTVITINGNVTVGSFQLSIKMYISATLDTSKYYLSISYKFKMIIEEGSTLIVSEKLKFLQGSLAHIKKGATVQISSDVYGLESYTPDDTWGSNGLNVTYPVSLATSQIKNDGYLLVDSGGKLAMNVESSTSYAILDVSSSSNTISVSLKGENYTVDKSLSLNGTLDGSSTASSLSTNVYVSQLNYKWKAFSDSYTLNYNKTYKDINDEYESSVAFTNHSESTSAITLTGDTKTKTLTNSYANEGDYKFYGWYYDEECTERIVDNTVYGSQLISRANSNNIVNVYAKFTKAPLINIQYYGKVSTNGIDITSLVDSITRQTIAGETITLMSALNSYYISETNEMKFYSFNGWNIVLTYLDGTEVEFQGSANGSFTIPKDYNGTSIKIIATEYVYDYSMYALIVSGGGLGYIDSSSFSVSAYDGSTSIATSAKTYYLMSDTEVTIKIKSGAGMWGTETTLCTLTGTTFANGTSTLSAVRNGFSLSGNTSESSFIVSSLVTLVVTHS